MPQTLEVDIEWTELYAWLPTRSSWSKKRIWFKKYWQGEIYYDAMGRPPIKGKSWKLVYTENEYLMYLLKKDEDATKDIRGEWMPRYPSRIKQWKHMMKE
tara:strand:+ start:1022 stop:1321 length:300 start_codon:yes stop_codon:yes gene_type:complete